MNYYEEIKVRLIDNEATKKVKDYSKNKSDLDTYYYVGKMLSEAGKHYGEGIIKEYSKRLTYELGRGYSQRNLRNMRQFYKISKKWQTMSAKLSWSHYCEILWFDDIKFQYYIKIIEEQNLSIRKLREKIKVNEYERLSIDVKNKLNNTNVFNVVDFIKSPVIIKNNYNYERVNENILKKLILEDIESFMSELGNNFCFIGSEYKIKLGDRYNYIDLLLFNIEFNCYVVIELKVVELRKEHIGQIEVYMNYIDMNVKKIYHDKTIGIIICKVNNKYVIKYCSDERIVACEYELL